MIKVFAAIIAGLLLFGCVQSDNTAEEILVKLQEEKELSQGELEYVGEIADKQERGEDLSVVEQKIITTGGGLTACRLGAKWCCNSKQDCDNLARDGDVYICNEEYNWEFFESCENSCFGGACDLNIADICGEKSCPTYTTPECNGKIVSGGQDECGCELPSRCEVETNDKDSDPWPNWKDCIGEDCDCPTGYTLTVKPGLYPEPEYYCKINKEFEDFESCGKESDCGDGENCVAQFSDNPEEYRCVPYNEYVMSCGCDLNGSCWCS